MQGKKVLGFLRLCTHAGEFNRWGINDGGNQRRNSNIGCTSPVSGDERQITLAQAEGMRTVDIRTSDSRRRRVERAESPSSSGTGWTPPTDLRRNREGLLEVAGIEPASFDLGPKASPSAAGVLVSRSSGAHRRASSDPARLVSAPLPGRSGSVSPLNDVPTRDAGAPGGTAA